MTRMRRKRSRSCCLPTSVFRWNPVPLLQSEHPFTLGFSKHDVRVTNHFRPDDPLCAMFSAIHEGGHGIFEQNVDSGAVKTQRPTTARYMGVHESQSRFFENMLGRNRNFWLPIYPQIQELLPELKRISLDDFCP